MSLLLDFINGQAALDELMKANTDTIQVSKSVVEGINSSSEAVKKILEAEALSDKKNAEARKQRDEIITAASGRSSLAIQKRLGEAHSELSRLKSDYDKKLEVYRKNAEEECQKKIESIKQQAEKNSDRAVDEIINRYF